MVMEMYCGLLLFINSNLILSIALFGAFKAGQVLELSTSSEHLSKLDLMKLKQKTEVQLEMLWKHYRDTNENENYKLPEGFHFKDIVDNLFLRDENLTEQIIGLNQIYLDLISNRTESVYFVEILKTYGEQIVGM